jgi:hypothetical protein
MRQQKVKRRVEFVVVEFGIDKRPELEGGTRLMGNRRIAIATRNLDRVFLQPPNARRKGAQGVEVAELQIEHAKPPAVARKLHVATRHKLDHFGKREAPPAAWCGPSRGPRARA